jgi:hypothetical protein
MTDQGMTRRELLRKGAIGGAIVWATPVIQVVGMSPAMAAAPSYDLLFFDDFSTDGPPNTTNIGSLNNWTISDGTVDLLAPVNPWISEVLSSTNYLDLDGSTGNAGTITTIQEFDLGPGTYKLSFALAGNHRNGAGEQVTLLVGNGTTLVPATVFSRDQNDPFSVSEVTFSGGAAGTKGRIIFDHAGGDNIGLLLDFVKLEKLT